MTASVTIIMWPDTGLLLLFWRSLPEIRDAIDRFIKMITQHAISRETSTGSHCALFLVVAPNLTKLWYVCGQLRTLHNTASHPVKSEPSAIALIVELLMVHQKCFGSTSV